MSPSCRRMAGRWTSDFAPERPGIRTASAIHPLGSTGRRALPCGRSSTVPCDSRGALRCWLVAGRRNAARHGFTQSPRSSGDGALRAGVEGGAQSRLSCPCRSASVRLSVVPPKAVGARGRVPAALTQRTQRQQRADTKSRGAGVGGRGASILRTFVFGPSCYRPAATQRRLPFRGRTGPRCA